MNKFLKIVIPFTLITYLIFAAGLYGLQKRFIYMPTVEVSVAQVQTRIVQSEDVSLKMGVMQPDQPRALIYFGGNAEVVYHNAELFEAWFPDYTIYLPNYRGYGGSTGAPDERGLYADALNVYDAIVDDHTEVSVIGRSVGTAVATHLASQRDVSRLVLVTPFAEMVSIAQKAFVVFPMQWLLTEQHRSIDRVNEIDADTLLLVAEWESKLLL